MRLNLQLRPVKDFNSNIDAQKRVANAIVEEADLGGTAGDALISLYRDRPVVTKDAATRLLGQRGPQGRIVTGGDDHVVAFFPMISLYRWAREFLAVYGCIEGEPDPDEAAVVARFVRRHGIPDETKEVLGYE